MLDYIRCMSIDEDVDPALFNSLTSDDMQQINDYINDPMTATTIRSSNTNGRREIVTSEVIYYWMISMGVPFDPCEKWHINRLLTLIRVCSEKNKPPKKQSRRQLYNSQAALNAARRAKYHSMG